MAGKKRNSSFEILTAMQDLNTRREHSSWRRSASSVRQHRAGASGAGESRALVKVQNKGRILTPQGERFLEEERSRREKMKAANELIEAASMETESGLEDILLVRKLLEGYAAEACAERIEPKELQKLKDLQADYLYAIRHGRAGSEEDLAFHLKIAHLSGSPSILRMLKLILTDQDAYARFNQAAVRSDEVRENEHESLLAAIEAGDGALARREMERPSGGM